MDDDITMNDWCPQLVLIDFGLSCVSQMPEDKGAICGSRERDFFGEVLIRNRFDVHFSQIELRLQIAQTRNHHHHSIIINHHHSIIIIIITLPGVDLYVLERALLSAHTNAAQLTQRILAEYEANYGKQQQGAKVIGKLNEIRLRGRKREMIG